MQDIATVGATLGAHLLGNKLIQLDKMLPEAGIHKEVVTHCCCLSLFLGRKTGDSPLGKLSSSLRGFFTDHQAM
jgi:hypothetical protein